MFCKNLIFTERFHQDFYKVLHLNRTYREDYYNYQPIDNQKVMSREKNVADHHFNDKSLKIGK